MSPEVLVQQAIHRGLRIQVAGSNLAVSPKGHCPKEFAEVLRRNKQQLINFLSATDSGLSPDCVPWLHVARQVLCGEFKDADSSTVESVCIGLRGISHPLCQAALKQIKPSTQ